MGNGVPFLFRREEAKDGIGRSRRAPQKDGQVREGARHARAVPARRYGVLLGRVPAFHGRAPSQGACLPQQGAYHRTHRRAHHDERIRRKDGRGRRRGAPARSDGCNAALFGDVLLSGRHCRFRRLSQRGEEQALFAAPLLQGRARRHLCGVCHSAHGGVHRKPLFLRQQHSHARGRIPRNGFPRRHHAYAQRLRARQQAHQG